MGKYSVRYVHAVSPSDKDVGPDIELEGGKFSGSTELGRALRKAGVLTTGGRIRNFRVEGDKVIVFPTKNGCFGPRGLDSNWHTIILTAIPAQDDEPLKPKKTQEVTYTSAPREYDYGFSTDLGVVAKDSKGRDIRKVVTLVDHVDTQRDRYYSGAIYTVADTTEFDKLVGFKLVTLTGSLQEPAPGLHLVSAGFTKGPPR